MGDTVLMVTLKSRRSGIDLRKVLPAIAKTLKGNAPATGRVKSVVITRTVKVTKTPKVGCFCYSKSGKLCYILKKLVVQGGAFFVWQYLRKDGTLTGGNRGYWE
jgi:hypothetical protein